MKFFCSPFANQCFDSKVHRSEIIDKRKDLINFRVAPAIRFIDLKVKIYFTDSFATSKNIQKWKLSIIKVYHSAFQVRLLMFLFLKVGRLKSLHTLLDDCCWMALKIQKNRSNQSSIQRHEIMYTSVLSKPRHSHKLLFNRTTTWTLIYSFLFCTTLMRQGG